MRAGEHVRTMTVHSRHAAAFRVTLVVRHGHRFQLGLRNRAGTFRALLIDTATYACTRRGAWDVCRGAYEPLPRGTYRFTVHKPRGSRPGTVRLAVRW
jgi:hypothetical protein